MFISRCRRCWGGSSEDNSLVSLEVEHSDQASISRIMEGAGYRVYKTLTNANNPNIIQDSIYEKV